MAANESFKKKAVYIITILFLLLFLRLPYAIIPFFNNDEAIYAAAANSILHGGIMYKNAADPCAPITPYIYAGIFKLFGSNNMFAVHVILIFLIAGISAVLFSIGNLLKDKKTGYLAALFFVVYSFTYDPLDVLAFNTEWLAAFFSSLGALFLLKNILIKKQYFLLLSGLFFGLGFFSKQVILLHFLAALIFCSFYFYIYSKNLSMIIKSILSLLSGFFLIVIFFFVFFYINNASKDFGFWFWEYHNKFYIPQIPLSERIKSAFQYLLSSGSFVAKNYFLPVSFAIGSIITIANLFRLKKEFNNGVLVDIYFVIWGLFAYMGAIYSGRNFGHYFILILPAFCILAGRTVDIVFNRLRHFFERKDIKNEAPSRFLRGGFSDEILERPDFIRAINGARKWPRKYKFLRFTEYISRISLVVVIFISVIFSFAQYFKYDLSIRLWKTLFTRERPVLIWPALREMSLFIKNNSRENDRIFVWGFYPEVYVLSNRLSASRYQNCNFLTGLIPWTNTAAHIDTKDTIIQGSWEIFINELNNNLPLYVIDTSFGNINFYGKYPPHKFKELSDILNEHYFVEKDFFSVDALPAFRLYKRKSS